MTRKTDTEIKERKTNNKKLLEAVTAGQTANIKEFLDLGANINTKGENGSRPLHIACQLRKFVVQKQLLSEGAKLEIKDKKGRTPLHYSAGHGDVESLKLLLSYKARIHSLDKEGCSALHYASGEGHDGAVDLLVFCGASSFQRDETGRTPLSICKTEKGKQCLKQSKLIVYGMDVGDIKIESSELKAGQETRLLDIGLKLVTPEDFGTDSISFLCRRIRPEFTGVEHLKAFERQLLLSDTFDFRMTGFQNKRALRVHVPIFNKPEPFEEPCLKTDANPEVDDSSVLTNLYSEGESWFVEVEIDLFIVKAFIIVTRPKVEHFPVEPDKPLEVTSKVDDYIKIKAEAGTFEKPGELSLEVIPNIVPLTEDDEGGVTSLGSFYDMSYTDDAQPSKDVAVTLPMPPEYKYEGDMYILSRTKAIEFEDATGNTGDANTWEVAAVNPKVKGARVQFGVSHFCVEVPVSVDPERCDMTRVFKQVEDYYKKSIRQQEMATLLTFTRPIEDVGQHWFMTVVEFLPPFKTQQRQNYWIRDGFYLVEHKQKYRFQTYIGTTFKVDISGNAKPKMNYNKLKQYHQKDNNHLAIHMQVVDVAEPHEGLIDISIGEKREQEPIEFEKICSLDLPMKERKLFREVFAGFTKDSLMLALAEQITDENQWETVCGYLGAQDEKVFADTSVEDKFKTLVKWRESCRHRTDLGVPKLLTALTRTGNTELPAFVREELNKWLADDEKKGEKFHVWLNRKIGEQVAEETEEFPEPMGYDFLSQIAKQEGVKLFQLRGQLDISDVELEDIKQDVLCDTDEQRVIEFLITFRDKSGSDLVQAFDCLISALDSSDDFSNSLDRALETAHNWVAINIEKESHFASMLEEFLDEYECENVEKIWAEGGGPQGLPFFQDVPTEDDGRSGEGSPKREPAP